MVCSSEIRVVVNPMSVVDRGGEGGGSDVHSHTNILLFFDNLALQILPLQFILYTLNYTLQADLVSHILQCFIKIVQNP